MQLLRSGFLFSENSVRESFTKHIVTIFTVTVALVTFAFGYGQLYARVSQLEKSQDRVVAEMREFRLEMNQRFDKLDGTNR